jgi:hypothetical protein
MAVAMLWLVAAPATAGAQESLNPTETPTKDDGGWVYWMAEGAIIIGGLILLVAGASYLRFAPRFSREEEDEAVPRAGIRAPEPKMSLQTAWAQSSPVAVEPVAAPSAVPAPQPATVGAPAVAATRAAGAATAAAAPAAAGTSAPPRPPRPKAEPVELDQETFDRVLQEQLAKGADRRVAEGRARSAAMKVAREKAGG